jgi:hypothetical protein
MIADQASLRVDRGAICSPEIGITDWNPQNSFHRILTKDLKN